MCEMYILGGEMTFMPD